MLYDNILTKAGTALLRTLCRFPYREFYPSELAKESNISITHTNRILTVLKKNKIISVRKSGRHELHKLNLENILGKEFLDLFHTERRLELQSEFRAALEEFIRKLKRRLKGNLISIILFGSVAKEKTTIESDIDLIIITDNLTRTKRIAEDLFKELSGIYGHLVEEHIYTKKDFDSAYRKGNDLIINVLKDGIILYDTDFFHRYLNRQLPRPTREHIEQVLNIARESLNAANKMCSEGLYESAVIAIKNIVRNCCRALLLLSDVIPGSKHDLPKQIKKIKPEYSKLLVDVNRLYRRCMEEAKKIEKETIIKYLDRAEGLLKETLQLFESG